MARHRDLRVADPEGVRNSGPEGLLPLHKFPYMHSFGEDVVASKPQVGNSVDAWITSFPPLVTPGPQIRSQGPEEGNERVLETEFYAAGASLSPIILCLYCCCKQRLNTTTACCNRKLTLKNGGWPCLYTATQPRRQPRKLRRRS